MENELDSMRFFNDKELWNKWYMRSDLSTDVVKQCRDLIDSDLFSRNWRTTLGVTLKWEYVKAYLSDDVVISDYGEYKTVYLDFHQSFLEQGKEDVPSNYWINVYSRDAKKFFAIPHKAIVSYYMAGWPRSGWDPRRFIVEPWEYLNSIKDFLDGEQSLNQIKNKLAYFKPFFDQEILFFIRDVIKPLVFMKNDDEIIDLVWKNKLEHLYQEAVDINKEEFKNKYLNHNPYTGVFENNFPLDLFTDSKQKTNPFLMFYKDMWLVRQ